VQKFTSAPGPGRTPTTELSSSIKVPPASCINVSPPVPWLVDALLPGGHYVRYASDPRPGPGAGVWRTGRDGVSAKISPLAITRIELGWRGGVAVGVVLPRTGEVWEYEGDLDDVASTLWRAGARIGFRGDLQIVYWAIYEFAEAARRRGVVL